MTSVLHATKPYGHYLQSYFTDEVIQQGDRYVVSNVRYRKDGEALTEIERHTFEPKGHLDLNIAIKAAEESRDSFLNCAEEERGWEVLAEAARERAYHQQSEPDDEATFEPFENTSGCNTRIDYLYRDDDNFKQRDSIVVAGVLSEQEQQELRDALNSDCFVPEQVGMRALQADLQSFGPGTDDVWHEIEEISITEDPTTFPGTAKELLAKFKATDWDSTASEFEQDAPTLGGM